MNSVELQCLADKYRNTLNSQKGGSGYKGGFDAGFALGQCHAIEALIKLCASEAKESLPTDKQLSKSAMPLMSKEEFNIEAAQSDI